MRRLFWKEWQERRIWIAIWLLTGMVTTALGKGQDVCDIGWMGSSWMNIIPLMALLTGLGGYGSELRGGRATFLYSRAVTWKQILAAKLLLGLAVVAVSVLLNAAAGYLFLPAEYHHLITLHGVLSGAYLVGGLSALAFVLGLAGSLVLPGLAGGLLVVVGWVVIMNVLALFGRSESLFGPILLLLAPLVGGFLLARFGVTLHGMARVRRFALIVLAFAAVGAALDYTPPAAYLYKKLNSQVGAGPESYYNVLFSPDARYVYLERSINRQLIPCLVRLSDGWFSFIDSSSYENRWLENGAFLTMKSAHRTVGKPDTEELHLWQWQGQNLRSIQIKNAGSLGINYHALSPDGRRLLLGESNQLLLCDLTTGKTRTPAKASETKLRILYRREPNKIHGLLWCWWQTNDEIGYLDPFTKKRVLVPLPALSEP